MFYSMVHLKCTGPTNYGDELNVYVTFSWETDANFFQD